MQASADYIGVVGVQSVIPQGNVDEVYISEFIIRFFP